jgi:hypothetical protein
MGTIHFSIDIIYAVDSLKAYAKKKLGIYMSSQTLDGLLPPMDYGATAAPWPAEQPNRRRADGLNRQGNTKCS